jgi:N-methylhydantoinase A
MLSGAGVPEARWEITRAADCRYGRQAYELTVPLAAGPVTAASLARLAADFHAKHRQTYGHASPDEAVQLVNLRVAAVGRLEGLDVARRPAVTTGAVSPAAKGSAPAASREAYFKETGPVRCDVIPREALGPGARRAGPLIIEAMDATVVVPPGWHVSADARGFISLEQEGRP